jgi:hypothetical protein
MHRADSTVAMTAGTDGGESPTEQIVGLLRDLAERLARGRGVDSDDARHQLHAINHAVRQVLVARRTKETPRCFGHPAKGVP